MLFNPSSLDIVPLLRCAILAEKILGKNLSIFGDGRDHFAVNRMLQLVTCKFEIIQSWPTLSGPQLKGSCDLKSPISIQHRKMMKRIFWKIEHFRFKQISLPLTKALYSLVREFLIGYNFQIQNRQFIDKILNFVLKLFTGNLSTPLRDRQTLKKLSAYFLTW